MLVGPAAGVNGEQRGQVGDDAQAVEQCEGPGQPREATRAGNGEGRSAWQRSWRARCSMTSPERAFRRKPARSTMGFNHRLRPLRQGTRHGQARALHYFVAAEGQLAGAARRFDVSVPAVTAGLGPERELAEIARPQHAGPGADRWGAISGELHAAAGPVGRCRPCAGQHRRTASTQLGCWRAPLLTRVGAGSLPIGMPDTPCAYRSAHPGLPDRQGHGHAGIDVSGGAAARQRGSGAAAAGTEPTSSSAPAPTTGAATAAPQPSDLVNHACPLVSPEGTVLDLALCARRNHPGSGRQRLATCASRDDVLPFRWGRRGQVCRPVRLALVRDGLLQPALLEGRAATRRPSVP